MSIAQQLQLWGQLNEAPPVDVVTFVRRVFEKTRAYEERVFYIPAKRRLFSVDAPRVWNWRAFAFFIRPGDQLREYRKRPARPNTFFVDSVTLNHREGQFYGAPRSATSQLSELCRWSPRMWRGSVLYTLNTPVQFEKIEKLKAACDTLELHIPGGRAIGAPRTA